MDNSFGRQERDRQHPSRFLAGLQLFASLISWLAGLIQLTEEEQNDAGIYFGNQRSK